MNFEHLIDLDDLSLDKLNEIIDMASRISKHPEHYRHACSGKILATLFYEPSTRTKMSFEAAMQRLGGTVIGFDNPMGSSVSKGETLQDTVKVVSGYSDILVIRHSRDGAALAAAQASLVPVINAGDGTHMHPTQTLADLVTLMNKAGRLDNLKIGLCGDLKNGRTVHSLIKTMCRYENNSFVLISSPEFALPDYSKDYITDSGASYMETDSLKDSIGGLDVLYMTRMQRERDVNAKESFNILDLETLRLGKPSLCVLHPLPRVDEITKDVDADTRAVYFEQTRYGMYARMSLILNMLGKGLGIEKDQSSEIESKTLCSYSNCITNQETYLKRLYEKDGKELICRYCEHRTKSKE
ncbi:MAG: aspartate carbamoyltransferase [Clostridia bacterium]|nr:aspartate carbamoyltransferase [Clostridia bacterium]